MAALSSFWVSELPTVKVLIAHSSKSLTTVMPVVYTILVHRAEGGLGFVPFLSLDV